jgi:multidrug efflux pump subunit AcrB
VLARIEGVADVQMFGERAHVRLDLQGADAGQRLSAQLAAAGLDVASVRPIATSLEDVFIARLSRTLGQ